MRAYYIVLFLFCFSVNLVFAGGDHCALQSEVSILTQEIEQIKISFANSRAELEKLTKDTAFGKEHFQKVFEKLNELEQVTTMPYHNRVEVLRSLEKTLEHIAQFTVSEPDFYSNYYERGSDTFEQAMHLLQALASRPSPQESCAETILYRKMVEILSHMLRISLLPLSREQEKALLALANENATAFVNECKSKLDALHTKSSDTATRVEQYLKKFEETQLWCSSDLFLNAKIFLNEMYRGCLVGSETHSLTVAMLRAGEIVANHVWGEHNNHRGYPLKVIRTSEATEVEPQEAYDMTLLIINDAQTALNTFESAILGAKQFLATTLSEKDTATATVKAAEHISKLRDSYLTDSIREGNARFLIGKMTAKTLRLYKDVNPNLYLSFADETDVELFANACLNALDLVANNKPVPNWSDAKLALKELNKAHQWYQPDATRHDYIVNTLKDVQEVIDGGEEKLTGDLLKRVVTCLSAFRTTMKALKK